MKPNRIAAIDIGTNSTKISVAELTDDGPRILFERSVITRLGKGVDKSHRLDEAAITRTVDAVVDFAMEARKDDVEIILGAGTSALRDAANGADFISLVKDKAGVDVEVITGDREAQLAFAAVRSDASLQIPEGDTILVFDIGGGSTELITGLSTVDRYRSLDIGAVRLTERFVSSDPPSAAELVSVENFARDALSTVPLPDGRLTVAGIGGTAVNIAAVLAGADGGEFSSGAAHADTSVELHGARVTRAETAQCYDRFRGVKVDERRRIVGLEPERADVIVAGTAILSQLLEYAGALEFVVSTRGLRYGMIADYWKSRR